MTKQDEALSPLMRQAQSTLAALGYKVIEDPSEEYLVETMDEAVYESCSLDATEINNAGLQDQLEYLRGHLTKVDRDAFRETAIDILVNNDLNSAQADSSWLKEVFRDGFQGYAKMSVGELIDALSGAELIDRFSDALDKAKM